MAYMYNVSGKRVSKDPHFPHGKKLFKALPDDPIMTVTWPGGTMSINQYYLEHTTQANRRKFIDLAIKANKTQEEINNGHKKSIRRRS